MSGLTLETVRPLATRPGWHLAAIPHGDGSAGPALEAVVRCGKVSIGLDYDGTIAMLVGDYPGGTALVTLAQVRDIAAQLIAVADAIEASATTQDV